MSTDQTYEQYRRAEQFLAMGHPTEAARLVAPVVEVAPESTAPLELLARALFASAQLARAETALRTLVERRPDDAWARAALGRTLERLGRTDDAAAQRRLAQALGLAA
jgi:Flp pilus assembly protein TadD